MTRQTKNKYIEWMFFMIFLIGITIVISTIFFIKTADWNNYWQNRFDSGQCKKICENNGLNYSGENPSFCYCYDKDLIITDLHGFEIPAIESFRRHLNIKDNLIMLFGK